MTDFATMIEKINFTGSPKQIAWAKDILTEGSTAFESRRSTALPSACDDPIREAADIIEAGFISGLEKMAVRESIPASLIIDHRSTYGFNGVAGLIDKQTFQIRNKKLI